MYDPPTVVTTRLRAGCDDLFARHLDDEPGGDVLLALEEGVGAGVNARREVGADVTDARQEAAATATVTTRTTWHSHVALTTWTTGTTYATCVGKHAPMGWALWWRRFGKR